MVAVVYCRNEERKDLYERQPYPDRLEERWISSQLKAKWRSGRCLTLVVAESMNGVLEVTYIGRSEPGRWTGRHDREIAISDLRLLPRPIPVSELDANLPPFVQRHIGSSACLPQKASETLIKILLLMRPELTEVVAQLQVHKEEVPVRGPVGQAFVQVRDAIGNILQMGGFLRDPLAEWQPPADLEIDGRGFLDQLPRGVAHEDALVVRDAERFLGWLAEGTEDVDWRAFTKRDQRLFIANCNRQPAEKAMGVDLIYFHEARRSFVLVQYKKLVRADDDWSYYPSDDRNLDHELERMRAVDEACEARSDNDDYRLNRSPCWIKLCRSETTIPRGDELVQGMYLTRSYFQHLRQDPRTPARGSKGGLRFGYRTVPRYLDNTTFGQLVSDGWIGSSGTGTDLIQQQIRASREGNREIVFGVLTGDDQKRAQRTQDRRQGLW